MIKLYNVKDDYIDYLRKFDHKVLMNKKETRPYVGVVLVINNMKYYVPLMSPKGKFAHMHNAKDFHKIAGGRYGAINFNKMIPVIDDALIIMDIDKEPDLRYKSLLQNQYRELSKIIDTIMMKSASIYNLFIIDDKDLSSSDIRVKERCCNFMLLEEKLLEYTIEIFEGNIALNAADVGHKPEREMQSE